MISVRDKVKLLVNELETNTVDSPHHCGWLHLRITNLSFQECIAISEGLKHNTNNVIWLDVSPVNISPEGFEHIIDSLRSNMQIKKLFIHGRPDNDLYDEQDFADYLIPVPSDSLAELMKLNKCVEELQIVDSCIKDDDVKKITDALKANTKLKKFYLESNPDLTVQSAHYLSELIKSTTTLTDIRFQGKSNVNDECAIIIASAMKYNRTVETLIMNASKIGDEGAKAFAEMLAVNRTLTNLNLFCNDITDVGAIALFNSLKHNSTLKRLSIGSNRFSETSDGGRALQEAKNYNLKYLYL